MTMTAEDLALEVRIRMGNPSVAELHPDSVTYAIESALTELSRLQPYYTYVPLDLVKGTEYYDAEVGVVDVREMWFTSKVNHFSYRDILGPDTPYVGHQGRREYAGLNVFHSPSLMTIIEEKWERLASRDQIAWEFNHDTRKILIIPTPKRAMKSMYKGVIQRTLATVNALQITPFKDLVRAESMEAWALKRSQIASIPIGVGVVSYDNASLKNAARELKEEALSKLKGGGGAVVIR